MKLKKLEIIGFKSFCEKSTIQFPPGVSAVVGPNGCGKSNVVDALRWVMGEQSLKQLRGKNKEDIIFAGANGKPPMSMAEVSITLLNDNGSAPEEFKDYSEIMVTRRLYRSGESGYLINKQPARLKDVYNIFAGSGVGPRTYAVIQQGNIGAITDAGPDERRVFIEEAAGVTRYKIRKQEALSKLKSTNQNLLRVNDIISEVNRQMAGLKRQARKAERYKSYQGRIRTLDTHLLLHYYDDLSGQIQQTAGLLETLKDTDIGHTTKLKKIGSAIEEIKLKRTEKNREISEYRAKHFEVQRKTDRMESDLNHFKEDVHRLSGETTELANAQKKLEEKNEQIIGEISEVELHHTSVSAEVAGIKSRLEQEKNESQSLREQLSELNQQLESHKSALMTLVADEARYKNIYQTASNNKENLKRKLRRIDEEEMVAARKVSASEKEEEASRKRSEEIKENIENLAGQIQRLHTELDEKSKSLAKHIKKTQIIELERNKNRSKLSTLKKMEDNFEWYKDGVRAIMKAKNAPESADSPALAAEVVCLMADIVEPDPEYETAVESIMGDALQYVLVKDQLSGTGAIDYLQKTGSGRGGFVPLDRIKTPFVDSHATPSGEHLLRNHVRVKAGYEKIVDTLLANVVVADDLNEAIETFNRNGVFQTIVTLEGDIISHQGVMIGGSRENLSGILAKKQELKNLEMRCDKLNDRLADYRQYQKQLEDESRALEIELQRYVERKNEASQEQMEAEKACYKSVEELKSARRHLEIVRLEQEQLMGEESDIDEEMARYNQALAKITSEVEAAQANVTRTSQSIHRISGQLEDFNQKVVDLKLKMTSCNADLENSANTLRRLKEFQEDGIRRLQQLHEENTHKNDKKKALEEKIEACERSLSGMYEEMKRIEAVLSVNETDFHEIDEALKENDRMISELQGEREETLQKIRILELELSEKRIKQENIESRAVERHHCSIDDLRHRISSEPAQLEMSVQEMERHLNRLREKMARIGDVNLGAIEEYKELKERFDFLSEQRDDLIKAMDDLHKVIKKINRITQQRFMETFEQVNEKLKDVFPKLFMGGTARLELTQPNNPLETGVEYMVHPAGKKLTRMSLLSGGEKALSAIAFIFSIFLIKPASFCLMDEIDAPLDDANVQRFNELLKMIGQRSQIIMITHNKSSMEFADTLFGITMEQKGVSKIVSVNLNRPSMN